MLRTKLPHLLRDAVLVTRGPWTFHNDADLVFNDGLRFCTGQLRPVARREFFPLP